MVEQERATGPPVFLPSVKTATNFQDDVFNTLFILNSADSSIEKAIKPSILDLNFSTANLGTSLEYLPDEGSFFNDSFVFRNLDSSTVNEKIMEDYIQPSTETFSSVSDSYFEATSPLSFWGACPLDLDTMKIDEVFQVDKDDLVQSPTLAELNANDESLFDSFDCFESFLSAESKTSLNKLALSDLNSDFKLSGFSNTEQSKTNISGHLIEYKKEIARKNGKTFAKNSAQGCLEVFSKSTQKESDLQTKSFKVDIKEENESSKPLVNKYSTNESGKNMSAMKSLVSEDVKEVPSLPCLSNNEMDTDEDSELDGEYSSDADAESEDEDAKSTPVKHDPSGNLNKEKKRSKYFWQYNMQSKGPKGPKMKLTRRVGNAHELSGVADPVFNANCSVVGVKHSGKARKGDGNDLTPNPKKLYNIGMELEKLTSLIEGLVPVHELPMNARIKSRKEKNKLASRACRLKKKAQHEANKLKLFGLQQEQKQLLVYINEIKKMMKGKVKNCKQFKDKSMMASIQALKSKKPITKVAGCSPDFVNNVLRMVASGDESGGLNVAAVHEN